jgi:hypothetical protein
VPKLDRALERGGLPLSRGRSLPALLGTRGLHASVGFERLLAARTLAASAPNRIKAPHRLFTLASSVDRLRDLLRRSILARLMLADEPDVIWALGEDSGVDATLAGDRQRMRWREGWRTRLDGIGAGFAAERARPAASSISQEDC